jgi:hypothetical protein
MLSLPDGWTVTALADASNFLMVNIIPSHVDASGRLTVIGFDRALQRTVGVDAEVKFMVEDETASISSCKTRGIPPSYRTVVIF